jgi:hypothetical protein
MSSIVSILAAAAVAGNVAIYEEVGTQKQTCAADESAYTLNADHQQVPLTVGDEIEVPLVRLTSEFYWYCGSKAYRAGNAVIFNTARAERSDDGEISWTFLMNWSR